MVFVRRVISTYRPSLGRSMLVVLGLLLCVSGCLSSQFVVLRKMPANPLSEPLQLFSRRGPQPTERTVQLLRRYDLPEELDQDTRQLKSQLQQLNQQEPAAEKVYALTELAYIRGHRFESEKDVGKALEEYGEAVASAYTYLLDSQFDWERNPYDPQFRRACDLYNGALEQVLRILKERGELRPGHSCKVASDRKTYDIKVVLRGNWQAEDFARFEFVSDYEIDGLTNHYRTFGLGVPLIAIRRPHDDEDGKDNDVARKYYPPQLAFPVTALLRVLTDDETRSQGEEVTSSPRCVLELYDPMVTPNIFVAGRRVPLETDLSTPLAYFLDQPAYDAQQIATIGLLRPDTAQQMRGVYMVEPYDPNKIPVMMVHGLWASPLTWMEMFNDLRGLPEIRQHCQFWFYMYPTGQPFWVSAAQMRSDLKAMRNDLDPLRQTVALDQMVLVGHSMGGLVSKLQTLESGDDFWQIATDRPFDQLEASDDARRALAETFFFDPNHSIRRVITIGTPHRGSEFSNSTTQLLGRVLIEMPSKIVRNRNHLFRDNPEYFQDTHLLTIDTSIESLAPDSPMLPVVLAGRSAPHVEYHNIVGVLSDDTMIGSFSANGDGVVNFSSSHLDNVSSEQVVDAGPYSYSSSPAEYLGSTTYFVRSLERNPWKRVRIGPFLSGDRSCSGCQGPSRQHSTQRSNDITIKGLPR